MSADDQRAAEADTGLYERLAAVQHDIWAHWMRYLLNRKSEPVLSEPTGLLLRAADVEHWRRQIDTPYAELTERERASDREQVDRYWPLIESLRAGFDAERGQARYAERGRDAALAELAETRDRRDYLQGQLDIIHDAEYSRNDALRRDNTRLRARIAAILDEDEDTPSAAIADADRVCRLVAAGNALAAALSADDGYDHGFNSDEVTAALDAWRATAGAPTTDGGDPDA